MASKWISKNKRQAIYARDNNVCCYCGKITCSNEAYLNSNGTIARADVNSLDHIVSQKELAAASTDDADFRRKQIDPKNLVLACTGCNSSKQETPLYVWCAQTGRDYGMIIAEIASRINKEI
jgi:5-methylcytosine-specific restriction endonuclease McrA